MLKEEVIKYDELTKNYNEQKEILKKREDEFKKQNDYLINIISSLKQKVEENKKVIEEKALEEYKETNNKKLFGGIGIQERKTIEYDETDAFNWAKEKDMFLILDKKSFDNAVVGLKLSFVKIDTEPKVTFPKVIKLEE